MDIHDVSLKRFWRNTTPRTAMSPGRYGLWSCGGEHVLCTWGYATGPRPGTHNTFDCEALISYWQGGYCEPEDLPNITDMRWKSVCGFDMPKMLKDTKRVVNTGMFLQMIRERIDEIDEYI